MKLGRQKAALIFLSLAVIAAGCTEADSSDEVSGQAVEIEEFSATPETINDDQPTSLRLTLRNVGEAEAENVEARLFNIDISDDQEDGDSWYIEGEETFDFNTLRPGDPEAGLEAASTPIVKSLHPPQLEEGVSYPYQIMTRLTFGYETTATTDIQLMSQRRYTDTETTLSTPTVENSDAPIQIDVQTRTPIVYYGDDSTSSAFQVMVSNEGDGTPYITEDMNRTTENKVSLDVSGEGIDLVPQDGTDTIDLVQGVKYYDLEEIEFNADQDIQRTIPITITADYNYYKEDEASVTVRGR